MREELEACLRRRALGYTYVETTSEYLVDEEGNRKLAKEREQTHVVPPDLSAIKTYLDLLGQKEGFDRFTDEQLLLEKERLLKELASLSSSRNPQDST